MESFYEGVSVTNSVVVSEDELLLSLHTEEWDKLVIFNLDTGKEKIIEEPESAVYFIDLKAIPRNPDFPFYFIAHTAKGIQLINADKRKSYDLSNNTRSNFNVPCSISMAQIDPDDPEKGFWLVTTDRDNQDNHVVKAFDFDENFVRSLRVLSDRAQKCD